MSRKGIAREIVDEVIQTVAVDREHALIDVELTPKALKSLLKQITRKINEANKAAAMAA
jgi:hypothetical protein